MRFNVGITKQNAVIPHQTQKFPENTTASTNTDLQKTGSYKNRG